MDNIKDGKLFSVKGFEGFIGMNGKLYRTRKQAIKYGGGVRGEK